MQRNIHGIDGFVWAIGVVEDRFDPLMLGRCKVRYFHHHPESKADVPTEDLPWSFPATPLDSGTNVVGPKEGDWVVAFFRDGILAQQPVMMAILPGIPEREANPEIGFYDPRPDSILEGHQVPRDPEAPEQHDDGSGTFWDERSPKSRFPDKRYLTESRASRLERAENISETIIEQKRSNVDIGQRDIPSANHTAGTGSDVDSPGDTYSEAETPYAAKYPYNHVYESEGGHFIEFDDTPGAERVHIYHRLGTFIEIHPDGTMVSKKVNDCHDIVLKNKYEHVEAAKRETVDWFYKLYVNKDEEAGFNYDLTVGSGGDINLTTEDGKLNITLNGDWNILVKGVATIEVEEDLVATVHKNAHIKVDEDCFVNIDGNLDARVGGNAMIQVDGDLRETVGGDCISFVTGDKFQYVGGDYTLVVAGQINEFAGKDIIRTSGSSISDVAAVSCMRGAAIEISDTAPLISHTAAVTNCTGILTGITTDSNGDVTPPGPPGIVPLLPVGNVNPARSSAIAALEAALQLVPPAIDAFEIAFDSITTDSEAQGEADATQANSNPNAIGGAGGASGGGAGGGGGGGGGGSKGGVPVDGPGGFLYKPSGHNSGVVTILYDGQGNVSIYRAVPDGEETVTNADGTTSTKPRYTRGDKIEDAQYIKPFHGDGRGIHRGSRSGAGYGGPIIVSAGGRDVTIEDPTQRHD